MFSIATNCNGQSPEIIVGCVMHIARAVPRAFATILHSCIHVARHLWPEIISSHTVVHMFFGQMCCQMWTMHLKWETWS